jgi:hypothetical protein
MTSTKPTAITVFLWVGILLLMYLQIFYIQGALAGLKSALLWAVVGYFLADIQIAVAHFEIDNFKPEDNGYKHHLIVAKYGFKYEELFHKETSAFNSDFVEQPPKCEPCKPCQPRCEPCRPGCRPCMPRPKQNFILLQFLFNIINTNEDPDQKLLGNHISFTKILTCFSPMVCHYSNLPIGLGFVIPMFILLNNISGSGSPDYYAHHNEKAPLVVKLAQQCHLMMSPRTHEKHHRNPRHGYAYFSPITNLVLDNSGFWILTKAAMEWQKNMKALPVPIPPSH